MKTKRKVKRFDCVEMKRKAPERLMSEYEARKDEFSSYDDFVRFKAAQSPLWKRFRTRTDRKRMPTEQE